MVRCTRRAAGSRRPASRRRAPPRTRRGRTGAGRRPSRPPRRTGPGPRGSCSIANTMPPLAVESSLVSTIPVSPTASWKAFAWARPFWPVVASSTNSVSGCGAGQALVDDPADLRELVHQVRLRVQAAGGVGDDDVGAAGDGRVERVVDDGARVRAGRVGDDRDVAPDRPRSGAARSRPRGTCRRRRGGPSGPPPRSAPRACRSSSSCRCR